MKEVLDWATMACRAGLMPSACGSSNKELLGSQKAQTCLMGRIACLGWTRDDSPASNAAGPPIAALQAACCPEPGDCVDGHDATLLS